MSAKYTSYNIFDSVDFIFYSFKRLNLLILNNTEEKGH